MTTGRTHVRFSKVYIDGYDMSGYTRSYGPLSCTFEEGIDDALSYTVKAAMPGSATVGIGTLNGLFDNTATSGLHVVMNGAGDEHNVMLPQGFQAYPVDNDPVFSACLLQSAYQGDPAANPVMATIPFANTHVLGANKAYARPWGVLLHASAAETDVNDAVGIDQLAASTKGGWMMYQVFAGDGTAAIIVEDASTNADGDFATLITSGTVDCSAPTSDIMALDRGASVKRYIRWQVALGTASTVTFALSWHRGL